jgi:glycosidase
MIGLTVNRDEVRTPMQWDGTKNAGFSSAEKTWLPVHGNYNKINVATTSKKENSLLNITRELLKIRKNEKTLQEGSLEFIENLPNGVLGYARKLGDEKIIILLNFDSKEKQFEVESAECIFKLSSKDKIKSKTIYLDGFGGLILK